MGRGRLLIIGVVALAAAACSAPQDSIHLPSLDKPATLASANSDLTAKLERYVALASQSPPTEPAALRSFYVQEDKALGDARTAFDSWSAYIDKAHAADTLQFPAGTTWTDADNYRTTLKRFLDDQREQMTGVTGCLEPVGYSFNAASPCISQLKAANLTRWQADQAALATAMKRAGFG